MISKSIQPPFIPPTASMDKEIRVALRSNKTYDEIISKEEANDPLPGKSSKKPRSSVKNWDEDF
jgi:hypothetical protein